MYMPAAPLSYHLPLDKRLPEIYNLSQPQVECQLNCHDKANSCLYERAFNIYRAMTIDTWHFSKSELTINGYRNKVYENPIVLHNR